MIKNMRLKNKSNEVINLFINQVDRNKAENLTLCSLTYNWLYATKELYKWELPDKITDDMMRCDRFPEKFIESTTYIQERNEKLKDIFTYLGVNDLKQVHLDHWGIFIDIFHNIKFSNELEAKELQRFFDEFIYNIENTIEKNEGSIAPVSIRKLVTKLLNPKEDSIIADITCGTGSFIADINEFIKDKYNDNKKFQYYAQDINSRMLALTKLRCIFNGITNFTVKKGDVLQDEDLYYKKFNYIVAEYPFNLTDWNKPQYVYKNFIPQTTNLRYIDWALNQYVINKLDDRGKAVVVLSKGCLIRSQEAFMRKYFVEKNLIESIILLPASLYFGTSIPVAIIIFNKNKPDYMNEKIQFIDASNCFIKLEKNKRDIKDDDIKRIVDAYTSKENYEDFSILVDKESIKDNKYNLNSTEYIGTSLLKEKIKNSILLGEVAEVKKGVAISKKEIADLKTWPTHYYINLKDIEDGEIKYENAERIEAKKDWETKAAIEPMDILVSSRGHSIKIAMVGSQVGKAIVSDNLLIIRIKQDIYDSRILKKYLESPLGKELLESIQTGSATVKIITAKNLERLPLPKIQQEYIKKLGEVIDYTEKKYKEAIEQARHIYDLETNEIYEKMNIIDIISDINKK
nr:putative DNA methyltransferase [Clostridium sp. K25]